MTFATLVQLSMTLHIHATGKQYYISHFEVYYIKGKHYKPVFSRVSANVATDSPPLLGLNDGDTVLVLS